MWRVPLANFSIVLGLGESSCLAVGADDGPGSTVVSATHERDQVIVYLPELNDVWLSLEGRHGRHDVLWMKVVVGVCKQHC